MVTVLMPAYNAASFLREAIESILKQTYSDFEFIIINDGSSDETENVILSYTDKRIRYFKNETNLGIIQTLNKGISLARGKFIARMDADDISLPDRLKEQVALMSQHTEMIVCGCDYLIMTGSELKRSREDNDSDYKKATLLFATCFAHPTVMIRNIFQKTDIRYDGNFIHAEDYKLWTDLAFEGTFGNVAKPLFKYRAHSGQISEKHRAMQHSVSADIRKAYLGKLGFSFTEEIITSLNQIGDNQFIRSENDLLKAEKCLLHLRRQNQAFSRFNNNSFDRVLHKFWIDTCGNTSLGWSAYRIYKRSELSGITDKNSVATIKLIVKCILRKGK
jgi:glycosyltransferase involved in cell wall biosynthesis